MADNDKTYYFIVWEEARLRSGGWFTMRVHNDITEHHPIQFIIDAQSPRFEARLRWFVELKGISPNKIASWRKALEKNG